MVGKANCGTDVAGQKPKLVVIAVSGGGIAAAGLDRPGT